MRNPPQPPPRRLRLAANLRQEFRHQDVILYPERGEEQEPLSHWFRRTYPDHSPGDLADFYRRTMSSPAVVVNPEHRYATFKMRMVGLAANYIEQEEILPPSPRRPAADISRPGLIAAAVGLAAILVAAVLLTV